MKLIIDGIGYKLWDPDKESNLEEMVKEHYKDIFGGDSIYFDFKPELRTQTGIGSKPDGCVITLLKPPHWHIVEIELSTHDVYTHIVPQITKFKDALEKSENRRRIVEGLYKEIDPIKRAFIETRAEVKDVHKFLSDLVSEEPVLVIITDEKEKARAILGKLPFASRIVEFKTFEREEVGLRVHAHLFEPIVKEAVPPPIKMIEKHFIDRESLRPIYNLLKDKIKEIDANVVEKFIQDHITFSRKHIFCSVSVKRNFIKVSLPLKGKVESQRFGGWPADRKWGYVRIRSVDEIDDELMSWVKLAYDKYGKP